MSDLHRPGAPTSPEQAPCEKDTGSADPTRLGTTAGDPTQHDIAGSGVSVACAYSLQHVPSGELLGRLKGLVGRSNQLTAHMLAHLAEVDARRLYREHACSSLYAYCIYELRMSEDEAQRRITAARTARRFPVLFEMLEAAAIHLTGILLLAPHLDEHNQAHVLSRARFRTKKEIQKLVAEIAPQPDVPAKIEPLAPKPVKNPATWAAYMAALAGPVRNIPPGNGPRGAPVAPDDLETDSMASNGTGFQDAGLAGQRAPARVPFATGAHDEATGQRAPARVPFATGAHDEATGQRAPARVPFATGAHDEATGQPATARVRPAPSATGAAEGIGRSRGQYRYKVQFTVDQDYVDLLEEARELLQHEVADRDLAEVHKRAVQALVEKLRKRRRAETTRPQAPANHVPGPRGASLGGARRCEEKSARCEPEKPVAPRSDSLGLPCDHSAESLHVSRPEPAARSRHIPAAVARAVWQRDGRRCAYVDHRGQRCRETAGLELHHIEAFCRGGPSTAENLAVYCRAHNSLAAERDLGCDFVERKLEERRASAEPRGGPL